MSVMGGRKLSCSRRARLPFTLLAIVLGLVPACNHDGDTHETPGSGEADVSDSTLLAPNPSTTPTSVAGDTGSADASAWEDEIWTPVHVEEGSSGIFDGGGAFEIRVDAGGPGGLTIGGGAADDDRISADTVADEDVGMVIAMMTPDGDDLDRMASIRIEPAWVQALGLLGVQVLDYDADLDVVQVAEQYPVGADGVVGALTVTGETVGLAFAERSDVDDLVDSDVRPESSAEVAGSDAALGTEVGQGACDPDSFAFYLIDVTQLRAMVLTALGFKLATTTAPVHALSTYQQYLFRGSPSQLALNATSEGERSTLEAPETIEGLRELDRNISRAVRTALSNGVWGEPPFTAEVSLAELLGSGPVGHPVPLAVEWNYSRTLPGVAAGGIGGSDVFGDDARSIVGRVRIDATPDRVAGTEVRWRATDLQFTIKDTLDFCPGELGTLLVQTLTRLLAQLEARGQAHDVDVSATIDLPDRTGLVEDRPSVTGSWLWRDDPPADGEITEAVLAAASTIASDGDDYLLTVPVQLAGSGVCGSWTQRLTPAPGTDTDDLETVQQFIGGDVESSDLDRCDELIRQSSAGTDIGLITPIDVLSWDPTVDVIQFLLRPRSPDDPEQVVVGPWTMYRAPD